MKNKKNYLLLLIAVLFLGIATVHASDTSTCDTVTKGKLRQSASNIKANYIVEEESITDNLEEGEQTYTNRYLVIKIYNLSTGMYVEVQSSVPSVSNVQTVSKTYYRTDMSPDGSISLRQDNFPYLVNYKITVYASVDSPCSGTVLRKINITLPKYNSYSNLDICDGLEDYYLCQEYITYDIDDKSFLTKLNEYKSKLVTNSVEDITNGNNNTASDIASGVSEYKYILVGVIISIGVVITILILKGKKKVTS